MKWDTSPLLVSPNPPYDRDPVSIRTGERERERERERETDKARERERGRLRENYIILMNHIKDNLKASCTLLSCFKL